MSVATHFMLEAYQEIQHQHQHHHHHHQQQQEKQTIESSTKRLSRSKHKRSRHVKEEKQVDEEEEKTRMVDDENELTHIVTAAAVTSSTVAEADQPAVKKAKLEPKENEGKEEEEDEVLFAEIAEIAKMNAARRQAETDAVLRSFGMTDKDTDRSAAKIEESIDLSPFKPDAIPALLDAAMELSDSALCHQFSILFWMGDPPLNLNSKSLIYGDTIGMRLVRLFQQFYPKFICEKEAEQNDHDPYFNRFYQQHQPKSKKFPAFSSLLQEHSERIKYMMDTIDPYLTNQQGQTMLHVIADETFYSPLPDESDRSSNLTFHLLFALIENGANLLARDHSGRVAIIELLRHYALIGLEMGEVVKIIMDHNPGELLNVANDDGSTLLRVSGYLKDQSVLIDQLVDEDEREVFRQIQFCDPEFDLLQLQAENDALRELFITTPNKRRSSYEFAHEIKRYERIQAAIDDWIQFNRPTRRLLLEPFLIPDLASIVTDYWLACEPHEPVILLSLEQSADRELLYDGNFFVLELGSSERTIEVLWTKILRTISRSSRRRYSLYVDKKPLKTAEDVIALTTGQKINIIYSFIDDEDADDSSYDDDAASDDSSNAEAMADDAANASDSSGSWNPSSSSPDEESEEESEEEPMDD